MTRVFLTGATGFIGSQVARLLVREGCEVTALVRPEADLRRLRDITDRLRMVEGDFRAPEGFEEALCRAAPEAALHLAWHAVPGRYLHARENLECVAGSLRLFEALERAGCRRVVAAGTCHEYDTDRGFLPETAPAAPRSLYAASKHALCLMGEQFHRLAGRSFAWARIFYLYGPWEDERRLVPLVARRLLAGEPCPLSPGTQIRDFLHVEDVAGALCAVARSELEGPVNIASGQPVSVADVARKIAGITGRPDLLRLGERPAPAGDPPFICADTSRLRAGTGWEPKYTLDSGLEATVAWWRTNV